MEIIRGLYNLTDRHRGAAVTIGNFDGVHLGHKALMEQLAGIAAGSGAPTTLVTFEPQPGEFFAGPNAPSRLTRFREKIHALQAMPLKQVLVLRFDEAFSRTAPEDFVVRYLVQGLKANHLLVGDDFRFGQGAQGDFEMLSRLSKRHGFSLTRVDTFKLDGHRVSSSRIREALKNGELDVAARLLGRPYSVIGRVSAGKQLGRTLGFATANLMLHRPVCPLSGVFAVAVHGTAAGVRRGMANVGTRPTVNGHGWMLEVHLFDFSGDLYGKELRVEFAARLRDERRFDSLDALRDQIERDMVDARAALGA